MLLGWAEEIVTDPPDQALLISASKLHVIATPCECTAVGSMALPSAGKYAFTVRVEEPAHDAVALVHVGVALAGGDNCVGNQLCMLHQGSGQASIQGGVLSRSFRVEVDMEQGTVRIATVGGLPWPPKIYKDADGPLPGVGSVAHQVWVPFCRVTLTNTGFPVGYVGCAASLQLEDFCHSTGSMPLPPPGGPCPLGTGLGDIQCVEEGQNGRGGLFISAGFAVNAQSLAALDIRAVLRLGSFKYDVAECVEVLTVNIGDAQDVDLTAHIHGLIDFQERHLRVGRNVLVHCGAGISRAGAAVVAHQMWRQTLGYDDALEVVRHRRSYVRPNPAFAQQLREFPIHSLHFDFEEL